MTDELCLLQELMRVFEFTSLSISHFIQNLMNFLLSAEKNPPKLFLLFCVFWYKNDFKEVNSFKRQRFGGQWQLLFILRLYLDILQVLSQNFWKHQQQRLHSWIWMRYIFRRNWVFRVASNVEPERKAHPFHHIASAVVPFNCSLKCG